MANHKANTPLTPAVLHILLALSAKGRHGYGIMKQRFEPQGMTRALFATALAQALVPVIALMIWRPPITMGVVLVFGLNILRLAVCRLGLARSTRGAPAIGLGQAHVMPKPRHN